MINNQHRRVLHEGPNELCYAKGSSHGYKGLVDLIENCKELSLLIACPKTVIGTFVVVVVVRFALNL
jgi:hypothetical protein